MTNFEKISQSDSILSKLLAKNIYRYELKPKTYSYLKHNDVDKKAEGKNRCVVKSKIKFEDSKNCLEAAHIKVK